MTKYTFLVFLCLSLFSACAFDDRINHAPTPSESSTPKPVETKAPEAKAPEPKPSETKPSESKPANPKPSDIPKIHLTWDLGQPSERSVKRNLFTRKDRPNDLVAENPITLPESAPDALVIKVPYLPIVLAKTSKVVVPAVHARLDALTNKPFELPVQESSVVFQNSSKGPADIQFTVLGLKGLLGTSKEAAEQKLFLNLELKFPESDSQTVSIDLIFMSPPAFLEFHQWTTEQYESKNATLPNESRVLKTRGIQLSLLQILETQNHSEQTLSFEILVKIKARLLQTMIYHPAITDPELCLDQEENRTTEYPILDSIAVLPFSLPMEKSWFRWLEQGSINLLIPPNNKILLGVYGWQMEPIRKPLLTLLNERRSSVYMKTHPLRSAEINLGCDFGCSWPNSAPAFEKQCSTAQGSSHDVCTQRVATCLPCIKRNFDRPNRDNPVEYGEDCNQCHLLEYQEKFPFDYEGHLACSQGWVKRPFSKKTIQYGYETREISLEVESASAKVRYGHTAPDEDPSFRFIRFLRKSFVQVP